MFPTWIVNVTMLLYTTSLTQPYQKLMTSYIFAEQYWFSETESILLYINQFIDFLKDMTVEGNVGSEESSSTVSPVWFLWKKGEELGQVGGVGSKEAKMLCS